MDEEPRKAQADERLQFRLDGGASFWQAGNYGYEQGPKADNLVASHLSVGVDRLLEYRANWSVERGEILAFTDDFPTESFAGGNSAGSGPPSRPIRLASQNFDQSIRLRISELAGAPLSLGLSAETRSNWMLAENTELQRERANLSWSPGPATVELQWAGAAPLVDDAAALSCNLKSSVRLSTRQRQDAFEALRISGRDCVVAADGSPWSGLAARALGISYVWQHPRQESEATLSMIDPAWSAEAGLGDAGPGYEFGLRHQRRFGLVSAAAALSLRQATLLESSPVSDYSLSATDTDWSGSTTLTWHLPEASLSANWARGVDRLWFTPQYSQSLDRFGLALNLSRWLQTLVPDASPEFAMNWNWSQVRQQDGEYQDSNSLRLDVALMF